MSRGPILVFIESACEDYMERDKMWIHVSRLKQDIGYTPYLFEAKAAGIIPLTFEQWLKTYFED